MPRPCRGCTEKQATIDRLIAAMAGAVNAASGPTAFDQMRDEADHETSESKTARDLMVNGGAKMRAEFARIHLTDPYAGCKVVREEAQ